MNCNYCSGSGELWVECCNGASGCACHGKEVFLGPCRVCNGTGQTADDVALDTEANIRVVKHHISEPGYIGNPYGRLR